MRVLVAIDDTDNTDPDCVGTGKLARWLARELGAQSLVGCPTVTRHQLLVHPAIPFTSHNSAACIEGEAGAASAAAIADFARGYLLEHRNRDANPGLCVMDAAEVPDRLHHFAKRAQQEVLTLEEADRLGGDLPGVVWSCGDTGQGRIGAMAAVALRASGEDGRFIGLDRIRDLRGVMRVGEIVARSPIVRVETVDGEVLAPEVEIDTQDWVRPALRGGAPVLRVRADGARWILEEKWRKWR